MKRIITALCMIPLLCPICAPRLSAENAKGPACLRFDFNRGDEFAGTWTFYSHNLLLPKTVFRIERNANSDDGFVLAVKTDSSTGFICTAPKFDLNKYPIMRWRWRIIRNLNLSENVTDPDDQAAVVYIGDNRRFKQCFVAYRWECNAPIGSRLHTRYRGGFTTASSFCLRNRTSLVGEWFTEERNVMKDFIAAFKRPPLNGFVLCVGANSQHSKSSTRIEIDYIEFLPAPPPAAK